MLTFICILMSMALITGCDKKEETTASLFDVDPLGMDSAPTPEPFADSTVQGLEVTTVSEPAATMEPGEAPAPAVTVADTVAYVFDGAEGPTLYGAAAYENTGNCPVVLTGASLSFNVGGASQQHEYLPVMSDIAVLLPGETGFIAWWNPDQSLTPGSAALAVELTCAETDAPRIRVTPKSIFLADNYPGFSTMTGSLESEGECSLNLVYTGFYDENGKLLGVWHFTKNAPLDPGESKNFAVHMKELPIENLAEKTAEIRTYGVGF